MIASLLLIALIGDQRMAYIPIITMSIAVAFFFMFFTIKSPPSAPVSSPSSLSAEAFKEGQTS